MSARRGVLRVLAVIGAVTVLSAAAGGVYLWKLVQRGFSARDAPSWLEAAMARAVREASIPARARELQSPVGATPETLAEARAHWADHCAGCHANNGSGDTPLGRNLFPEAPDMRQAATQSLSDGELYYVIQNGIRLTGMPAWGEPVDDDRQSWSLVAFIRHLPSMTLEEAQEMKRLNPRSVHEAQEQEQEDAFLNQTD